MRRTPSAPQRCPIRKHCFPAYYILLLIIYFFAPEFLCVGARGWPLAVVLFLMEPFEVLLIQGLFLRGRGGRVPDYQLVDQCISNVFIYLSGSTPKSTTQGQNLNHPNSHKIISRWPRKSGRIWFFRKGRRKCRIVFSNSSYSTFIFSFHFFYKSKICTRFGYKYHDLYVPICAYCSQLVLKYYSLW